MKLVSHAKLKLKMRVLRRIFGRKGREWWETGEDSIMRSFIVCTLHEMLLRRVRWAVYVYCMGEIRNACRILVGKPEGKRQFGRPRPRWEDNIRMVKGKFVPVLLFS
jgi:hypothetical protein